MFIIENEVYINEQTQAIQKQNLTIRLQDFEFLIFKDIQNKTDAQIIDNIIKTIKCSKTEAMAKFYNIIFPLMKKNIIKNLVKTQVGSNYFNINSILLEITDVCNFNCPHCYVDKTCVHNISFEQVKKIVKEASALGCKHIIITGGEPLLNPQFLEIYDYIFDSGLYISINTNGSLLTKEIIQHFKERPPVTIEISLYGYNEKSYNNFTKSKNCFKNIMDNIKELQLNNTHVSTKSILTKSNEKFFNKIKALAKKSELEFRYDYLVFTNLGKTGLVNDEQLSCDALLPVVGQEKNIEKHFIDLYNTKHNDRLFKCKIDDDSLFINSKLDISICPCMSVYTANYKTTKLENIILQFQKIKNLKFSSDTKCKNCKYISLCRYCPAKFYLITKNLESAPKWFCDWGEKIFNTYIKGIKIIRVNKLSDAEIQSMLNITKSNMGQLNCDISDNMCLEWINNTKNLVKQTNYLYSLIYKDGLLVGYYQLFIKENKIYLADVEFDESIKYTSVILEFIQSILNDDKLRNFEELYFNVNKNNYRSIKTFVHLGAEQVGESEKSYKYTISRSNALSYLNKLKSR